MNKTIVGSFSICLLIGFGSILQAQEKVQARTVGETTDIQNAPNADEQISAFVRRIFQDKSGNLWFGTNGDGVVCYDGDALKYFSIKEGFGGVAVRGIVEDKEGNVWFGTEGGITKYDPSAKLKTGSGSFTNFTETDGLVNNDVWSIVIDSKGIIWIGTLQGVSRFDGTTFTPFELPASERDPTRGVTSARIVLCIMEDSKGKMWFATNGGAYIYDPSAALRPGGKSFTNFQKEQGLTTNAIQCTFEDKQGRLWLGGWQGLFRYDGKSMFSVGKNGPWQGQNKTELPKDTGVKDSSPPAFSATLFEEEIRPLLVQYCADCHEPGAMKDRDFLTAETETDLVGLRGLYVDVVQQMESRKMPPGDSDQPSDADRKLVTDWLKTSLRLKPEEFDRIAPYVVEVYEDINGNLWFGTMSKGIARYDGKTLKWFSKKDGLPSNAVPSFAEDKDGNLWVGTQAGVCRFNGKTFARVGSAEGLPDRGGATPMEWTGVNSDRKGNIWASTGKGVFRYDGKSFIEFKLPIVRNEITSYAITAGRASLKLEDNNGNLWFGTDGAGAFKFDGKSFTHFTKNDGLCSNNINSILEDKQGNIWFTCMQSYQPEMTGDGGVCRYDGKTFTKFPKVKGLSENDIYSIYETKAGNIWIGASGVGAYRYDGETFTLFSETDRKHWTRNFGVQGIEEDKNGTLWFGFSGGLFRFNGKSFFNVTKNGPWK